MCAVLLGACGEQPSAASDPDLGDLTEGLLKANDIDLWPTWTIPVCWKGSTFDDGSLATFRDNTRVWLAESISTASRLQFTGWRRCTSGTDNMIVIDVGDWSHSHIGWQGDFDPTEVTIGRAPALDGRAQAHVVHEFMHAIGFEHEFDRAENTNNQCKPNSGATGNTYGTPYDPRSVTNSTYCGVWSNLSSWDVAGLRAAYGGYYAGTPSSFLAGNRMFVVYPGTGGVLYFQRQNSAADNGWDPPKLLGAPWNAAKEVVLQRNQDGRLEAFYIGLDDVLYHNAQVTPGGAWGGEALLGSRSTALHLVVARNGPGHLEVFYMGTDNVLYHKWQNSVGSASWSAGTPLVNSATKAINLAVAANADGRLEVAYAAPGNLLFHTWQTSPGGAWSGEHVLGGWAFGRMMELMPNQDGRLELIYTGTDDALYHLWQGGPGAGWSSPSVLGAGWGYAKRISAARNADGRIEVFYLGTDDALYHVWQHAAGGEWSGHSRMAGSSNTGWTINSARNFGGHLEVFYTTTRGVPNHLWQEGPGGAWSAPVPLYF